MLDGEKDAMGGWAPWTLLAEQVELVGQVVADPTHFSSDDGDWCLGVRPDPGYEHLLTVPGETPSSDQPNAQGIIECEVFPPGQQASDQMFGFGGLVGRRVKVVGPWVNDTAHGVKTEIHPIHLVRTLDPIPYGAAGKSFSIQVFSESSNSLSSQFDPLEGEAFPLRGRLFLPPDAGTSYTYDEDLPMPSAPADGLRPFARFVDPGSNWYLTRSLTLAADNTSAHVHVETGTDSENHGYAGFTVVLGWESAQVCQPLFDQITELLGELVDAQDEMNSDPKPIGAHRAALAKQIQRIAAQLSTARHAAQAGGCGPYPY